jgi:hypothetical protein
MKAITLACGLFTLALANACAADSPWTGTWKLDESRSHLVGDTFSYSKGAGDQLHYWDGSTISYDFAIDGKEYKSAYNRTTSWAASGKDSWDQVTKIDGRVLSKSHRTLSPDGRTLTVKTTGTRPDGHVFEEETVYTRLSGTEGLIGKWRSVKAQGGPPGTFIISSPAEGVLHIELPEQQQSVEGRADGSDHPITGPTAPSGFTTAYRFVTPRKISYVLKVSGVPDSYGVWSLAADGKSYTDVSWSSGKKNEKTTAVYNKQ